MSSSHLNHQVRWWGGVQNGQNLIVLYKENIFVMNNDIWFRNREWTRYSLTHFEDHFWITCLGYFLDPYMCGFQYICRDMWSQILVANWQN